MVNIYNKILLAVDDSSNSSRAINKVIDLQKSWNCKVVIFHSIKHPIKSLLPNIALLSGSGTYYVSEQELLYEYKKAGDKLLRAKQELFNNKELPVETRLITDEAPEEYIEKV